MLLRDSPLSVIGRSTILTRRSGSPLGERTTISPSSTVMPRPPALIDSHRAGEAGARLDAPGLGLMPKGVAPTPRAGPLSPTPPLRLGVGGAVALGPGRG